MIDEPMPRKRGPQRRAARNDRALLDAAREVFAEQGFDAPVSAVAERAGVGIGSLYRRYRTKDELLQRLCTDSLDRLAVAAKEGLDNPDPWDGLVHYIRRSVADGFGLLGPLAGAIEPTPEMNEAGARADTHTEAVVARAHAADALRPDVTTMDLFLLIGQLSHLPPGPPQDAPQMRDRLLVIAVDGLHPDVSTLPGPAPDPRRYRELWEHRRQDPPAGSS
ncbi:TetR/AcrR family transcriptional regulator [Amycolatopsis ultiminotia]|uniref:TetR/AcrR family transcriptional regulator n=1 Tax=Amycolatopsis ultiminotia TaxID=543629 RepID=A0ABP6X815_9PSEU